VERRWECHVRVLQF